MAKSRNYMTVLERCVFVLFYLSPARSLGRGSGCRRRGWVSSDKGRTRDGPRARSRSSRFCPPLPCVRTPGRSPRRISHPCPRRRDPHRTPTATRSDRLDPPGQQPAEDKEKCFAQTCFAENHSPDIKAQMYGRPT